jgi:hypothetical protein
MINEVRGKKIKGLEKMIYTLQVGDEAPILQNVSIQCDWGLQQ